MSIIVQKYGGSSVADFDKIRKVAAIIANVKQNGFDVAVVVSAMGKTTNGLIEMANQISENPPKRELDMLLSTGERVTMSLLCIALNELGINAISLTGSQAGIITDARHNDARVIEVRPFRVEDELAAGNVVVIGGFQGVSYKRDITTLGRGGSDTSAVALAAALNAERCEIYSDVDGVYTTDPNIVAAAKHLPEISYQQMQEMATAGAKVLNSQAVQFAKEKQIAIYARASFNPGKETIVRKFGPGLQHGVNAVVYEQDIIRVLIRDSKKYLQKVLSFLEEKQTSVKELSVVESIADADFNKVSFVISKSNVYGWEKIKSELVELTDGNILFEDSYGTLSLIGEGFNTDNSLMIEVISLLSKNGIPYYGMTTTSFRISLLIDKKNLNEAIKICHKNWIEKE